MQSDGRRESHPYIIGHGAEFDKSLRVSMSICFIQNQLNSIYQSLSTSPNTSIFLPSSHKHVPTQLENISAFSEDLPTLLLENQVNTPISSYVRRKTPQTSPISPTFPRYIFNEQSRENISSLSSSTMPFMLPTLPSIHSDVSPPFSAPSDAGSDWESSTHNSPFLLSDSLPEIMELEVGPLARRSHHTGFRLSAPYRADMEHHRSREISPV
jgi:hypothetical protein